MSNVEAYFNQAIMPLLHSIPELERRDTVIVSGPTAQGSNWVSCCSYIAAHLTGLD